MCSSVGMKYHIVTYGCSLNQSDSEFMRGVLEERGHRESGGEEADVVIVNSCTVKEQAENKLFRSLQRFKDKKIVVAGCVPQAEKGYQFDRLKGVSLLGTNQLARIGEVAEKTVKGERVVLLAKKREQRLLQPKVRRNPLVEILPIHEGCLGVCSYCKTKQARGSLVSYPVRDIKLQLRSAVREGVKEVWLTSQDTGCYGLDSGSSFPELMDALLEEEGDFRIRIGMCNPDWVYMYKEELKEIFKDKRVFRFLHIPFQSGSDRVLRVMERNYSVEDFLYVCKELRAVFPDLTIATDVIVGFPSESDGEFEETVAVLGECAPDVVNVSRFWARPGTKAAGMKQVPTQVIKERGQRMTRVAHEVMKERNGFWLGWRGEVLVDEVGREGVSGDGGGSTGRNYAYKPVIVSGRLGEVVGVEVVDVSLFDLRVGTTE